jgi:hypothetical protein
MTLSAVKLLIALASYCKGQYSIFLLFTQPIEAVQSEHRKSVSGIETLRPRPQNVGAGVWRRCVCKHSFHVELPLPLRRQHCEGGGNAVKLLSRLPR